jgi:hypothetical protein
MTSKSGLLHKGRITSEQGRVLGQHRAGKGPANNDKSGGVDVRGEATAYRWMWCMRVCAWEGE